MASIAPFAQSRTFTSLGSLPIVENELQNEKAWKEALDLCRKRLNSSEADIIFQTISPKDIRKYLEDIRQQRCKNKLSKSVHGINICIDALMRHERAIDMFAQAGGTPGCFAWGCTRLVLEVYESPSAAH